MTSDGWLSGIGRPLIVYSPASAFYLITYFLLTSLVLTNVVIAVLLDKFVGGDIPDMSVEEMQIVAMLEKLENDKEVRSTPSSLHVCLFSHPTLTSLRSCVPVACHLLTLVWPHCWDMW